MHSRASPEAGFQPPADSGPLEVKKPAEDCTRLSLPELSQCSVQLQSALCLPEATVPAGPVLFLPEAREPAGSDLFLPEARAPTGSDPFLPEARAPTGSDLFLPEARAPTGSDPFLPEARAPTGSDLFLPEAHAPTGSVLSLPEARVPAGPVLRLPEVPAPAGSVLCVPGAPVPTGSETVFAGGPKESVQPQDSSAGGPEEPVQPQDSSAGDSGEPSQLSASSAGGPEEPANRQLQPHHPRQLQLHPRRRQQPPHLHQRRLQWQPHQHHLQHLHLRLPHRRLQRLRLRLPRRRLQRLCLRLPHRRLQRLHAVFPHIVPNRLQFFEYKSVSVHCEEDNNATEWSVKWNPHEITNSSHTSSTSPSPYTIYPTFESHSGEYWCETEHGIKSETVNITITAGFVILESPAYPVKEGNEVIFNCKNKKSQSEHITDFYKDGVSLGTWYQSSMTIKNVSKSDEGLYKCSIDGAGESPESWLTVIKQETGLSQSLFPETLILLWTVICVLLVDLSLVVLGLLYQNKQKVSTCFSSERNSCTHEDDTVLQEENTQVKYAMLEKELKVSIADINPCFQEETAIYSSVN
ncbi:unnamed protein product [Oreochromis niloticus]|nr:unnamed protein product [Mustela putorius furo]